MNRNSIALDISFFDQLTEYVSTQKNAASIQIKRSKDVQQKTDAIVDHIKNVIKFISNTVTISLGIDILDEIKASQFDESFKRSYPIQKQDFIVKLNEISTKLQTLLELIEANSQELLALVVSSSDSSMDLIFNKLHKQVALIRESQGKINKISSQQKARALQILDQLYGLIEFLQNAQIDKEQFSEVDNKYELKVKDLLVQLKALIIKIRSDLQESNYQQQSYQQNLYQTTNLNQQSRLSLNQSKHNPLISNSNTIAAGSYQRNIIEQNNNNPYLNQSKVNLFLDQQPIIPSNLKILDKPLKTMETHFSGQSNWTMLRLINGSLLLGGNGVQLQHYNNKLQMTQAIDVSQNVMSSICIGDSIFVGQYNQILVLDFTTLSLTSTIQTQSFVNTFLQLSDDHLLFGNDKGILSVIYIPTKRIIFNSKLSGKQHIYQICKSPMRYNEYAFATWTGLYFGTLTIENGDQLQFFENQTEFYFKNQRVNCVEIMDNTLIYACLNEKRQIQVIDRDQQTVIKTIGDFEGGYNSIQKIIGFSYQSLPYLIIKDKLRVYLVNTKTDELSVIAEQRYDMWQNGNGLIQYFEEGQVRIMSIYDDQKKDIKGLREFIIAKSI